MPVKYLAPEINTSLPGFKQFQEAFGISVKSASGFFIQPEYHFTERGEEKIVGYHAKNGSDYNTRSTAADAMLDFLRIASESIQGICARHVESTGLKLPPCFSLGKEGGEDIYFCDTVERQEKILKRAEDEKKLVAEGHEKAFFAHLVREKSTVIYYDPEKDEQIETSLRDFRRNVFDLEEKFSRECVWLATMEALPGTKNSNCQESPETELTM